MFAIIESGSKQFIIQEGDSIRVEKIEGEPSSTVILDKVLLVADGEKISVGTPYLKGMTVTTKKVRDGKNKKLVIYKYKRRKDFDKKKGHRQKNSTLKIEKINFLR
ncbi:MAG: 50S ribosomal protein L21 [Candidatus Aureabacteria bacterium]|nr:50S ribosomal protein L21 [Candidatus Auribacterota bacterium]